MNSQSNNFTLQVDSPAIGANVRHSAYDIFEQLYDIDIYVDFNGKARDPANPSIGAFEFTDF